MIRGNVVKTSPTDEKNLYFNSPNLLNNYLISGLARVGQIVRVLNIQGGYDLKVIINNGSGGLTTQDLVDKSKLQETKIMVSTPTASTTGKAGDVIEVDGTLYECFGQNNNEYIWKKVGFSGGAIFSGDITVTPNITPEKQLENAIKAGDITPGMLVSLLEDGKYKNYIIQTIVQNTGACTKTQSGGSYVVASELPESGDPDVDYYIGGEYDEGTGEYSRLFTHYRFITSINDFIPVNGLPYRNEITVDNEGQSWLVLYQLDGEDKIEANRVLLTALEPYNLYDPTYDYTIIDASGGSHSSFREYAINPDGSITCTAYAQNVQRLLRNSSITLTAGTYTISGKMTLNDNVTDTTARRLVRCRIGINTAVKDVPLTTERGGSTNVTTTAAEGWFAATFDLTQAESLSFEMIPFYGAYGGTDHPCVISDLLVIKGDGVGLYSDNASTPADLRARYRIDQLAVQVEQTQLAVDDRIDQLATDVDDRIDQLATDVDDRIDQLAVQGTDNRFRFSGTFTGGVKSGVTITRLGSNRLILNGTATAGFNLEFAFHSYRITPLTLYYQMHCSDGTATGRFWLTNGYFDANNAAHQISPNITATDTWVKVVYPPSAVDSRTYLHVESGAVFDNTAITFIAVPSVISIDISDAIDRDVLHNTFIADYNTADYQTAVDNYNAALVATSGDTEQFLFFTDPHLAVQTGGVGGMKPITEQCINLMQAVYNAAPLSYCICGGDWLGNGDTPATAASKLSYIDGFCKKKFINFLPVIGNHDTNYQGTARFSVDMIKNLTQKTRDEQRLYYRYDTPTARLYVFDTGTENEAVGAYQNSQLEWFANSLDTDNSAHIILTMHIVYYSPTNLQVIQPISDKILEIAAAYNARGSVAVNGTTHDYSAATGTVSFCIAGHTHFDHESVARTIPVVLTTNTTAGNTCTFDMCLVDWTAKKLYLKRVGSGSDREVNIL